MLSSKAIYRLLVPVRGASVFRGKIQRYRLAHPVRGSPERQFDALIQSTISNATGQQIVTSRLEKGGGARKERRRPVIISTLDGCYAQERDPPR